MEAFSERLVREQGVLLAPGTIFGHPGNHFLLGYGRTDMPDAPERLEAFVS